jgi:hypothetical protein
MDSPPPPPPRNLSDAAVSDALRELLDAHTGAGGEGLRCVALCPICRAADVLRSTAPDDLRDQWQAVQREALLTMKALIDHYVERLDAEPPEPGARVQDIPIS